MNARPLPLLLLALVSSAALAQEPAVPPAPEPALRKPAFRAPTDSSTPETPAPVLVDPGAPADLTTPPPAPMSPIPGNDPALDLMPAQPGQLMPPPTSAPKPGLIPETPSRTGKPKAPKKSKTEIVEEELADRIRFRQAQTRALADPQLQQLWNTANTAHTDFEKREGLKQYYKTLFGRIRKLDPKVKKLADERETVALHRLTQSRLTPTEPRDAAERSTSSVLSADLVPGGF